MHQDASANEDKPICCTLFASEVSDLKIYTIKICNGLSYGSKVILRGFCGNTDI